MSTMAAAMAMETSISPRITLSPSKKPNCRLNDIAPANFDSSTTLREVSMSKILLSLFQSASIEKPAMFLQPQWSDATMHFNTQFTFNNLWRFVGL
jgi:hypothetical protein